MDKTNTQSAVEQQEMFTRHIVPEIPLLLRVARSLTDQPADAEDLVQETLMRAYRGLAGFDGDYPRAWLLAILHNTHISTVRRRTPLLMFSPEERNHDVDAPDGPGSPESTVVDETFDEVIEQALNQLRRPNLQVIELVDIEGLTYAQAAIALDIPLGTVVSRLHRARKQIRAHLASHGISKRGRRR